MDAIFNFGRKTICNVIIFTLGGKELRGWWYSGIHASYVEYPDSVPSTTKGSVKTLVLKDYVFVLAN